jgi:hypothetical protein
MLADSARHGWLTSRPDGSSGPHNKAAAATKHELGILLDDARPPAATARIGERRRPNRIACENEHLIRLMRDPASIKVSSLPIEADREAEPDDDPLGAAKGIATGVALSFGCWIAVGAAIRCLF